MSSNANGPRSVKKRPDHLVVLVHGINGCTSNWKFGADQLIRKFPDNLVVHCSERNMKKLTRDGIDVTGERLAKEVMELIQCHPEIRKISFVAHSAGGLIARYAVGRLYKPGLARPGNDELSRGTIHGLEAINFITLATPHLGSRQVPFLFGLSRLETVASYVSPLIFGRTGMHLFLTDSEEGKPPLLQRMVSDHEDLYFISALSAFRRRVVYSNACYDHMVGWTTSSIRLSLELPQWEKPLSKTYPHVVHEEYTSEEDIERGQFHTIEEELVFRLRRVSWEKVDVSFHTSLRRFSSHTLIQVNNAWCHEGSDVIQHIVDHFVV